MDRYATLVRLFDSYWYNNLSLTQILMVNILLRALKSFNTIYNRTFVLNKTFSIQHLYENRTFSHSCNFLMQIRFTSNCLKSFKTNHFKHKSICTFLSIIPEIQIINYSNILEIERGFENKPKIVALIPIFRISTSMRPFLLVSPYSNTMAITY